MEIYHTVIGGKKSILPAFPEDSAVPCAIYLRAGPTSEDCGHQSLAEQEKECLSEIRKKNGEGWFLHTTISDPSHSGSNMKRPGLLNLLELVKSGKVKVVVVPKRDRLFRGCTVASHVQAIFDLYGVRVLSCVEGLNNDGPVARFTRNLIDICAQIERSNAQINGIQRKQQGLPEQSAGAR